MYSLAVLVLQIIVMKLIILSLFLCLSKADYNRQVNNEIFQYFNFSFKENDDNMDEIEASGEAPLDNENAHNKNTLGKNTLGQNGRVMVQMLPPDEDWVNDLETWFQNIFSNEQKMGMSAILLMLFIAVFI